MKSRTAALNWSGCSKLATCPQRGIATSPAPRICSRIDSPVAIGARVSSSPQISNVGTCSEGSRREKSGVTERDIARKPTGCTPRMIDAYGGIAKTVPLFAALLTLVSLSSIGVPGTNGFVGEFLVLLGAYRTQPVVAIISATAVIFAAAYLLWAIQRILFNPLSKPENAHMTSWSSTSQRVAVDTALPSQRS